jgi:hypothetical protein
LFLFQHYLVISLYLWYNHNLRLNLRYKFDQLILHFETQNLEFL